MSQRQVNLKGGNIGEAAIGAVDILTKSMQGVAKQQLARREQSEKAILIGNQTAEALIDKYGEQTKSTDVMVQTGLTNAIREQAMQIGKAKYLASKPGATQEDRDNYLNLKSQGQVNLDALAKWSVNTEENKNAYKLHQQAVENGTNLNRLSRDVLTNDPDLIEFENLLTSGTASDVKIDFSSGKPTFTVFDANGKGITRNIYDDNQAFSQTGNTIRGQAITKEDLIDGDYYKNNIKSVVKNFKDLQPKTTQKTKYDRATNTQTTVAESGVVNARDNMLSNHEDFLLSLTKNNFGKQWDQLNGLNLLEDSKLKDISWGTLNNPDYKAGASKLNSSLTKAEIKDIEVEGDTTPGKITEDDYLELQKKMRKDAAVGLANLIENFEGQPTETILKEIEIENKYKVTEQGVKKFTSGGIQELNTVYKNKYLPALPTVNGTYNGFEGVYETIKNNPEKFGVDTSKGLKVRTGDEIKKLYPSTNLGNIEDDAVYEFDPENPQKRSIVTKPEFFGFDGQKLDAQGRQTMFRLLEVNDYQQGIFTNPKDMALIGIEPNQLN